MPNYKPYNQKQNLFITFDSDEFIPKNSLARHIDYVFEKEINIEKFETKIKNDTEKGGAPAFNVRMMLKVIFYSYTQSNYSSRTMEKKCMTDVYYIFLSGYQKVDHSTICRFIDKYGEEITEVFSQVVYILEKSGYINRKIIAIDGSKIKASANKRFCGTVAEYKQKQKELRERINYLINKHKQEDTKDEEKKVKQEKKINRYEKWHKKISGFLKELAKAEKPDSVKNLEGKAPRPERYNLTDGDCRIMKSESNGIFTGYNAQTAVDEENNIIVTNEVYNRASDKVLTTDIVNKVELKEETKLVMDAGYHSIDALIDLDKKKIDAYIPEGRDDAHLQPKKTKYKGIGVEHCEKIKEKNKAVIKCPGGQEMESRYIKQDRREKRYVFHPDKAECAGCSYYKKCQGHIKKLSRKKFEVSCKILDNIKIINEMKKKLQSAEGREIYNKRIGIVEHPFGEIKEHKKFQRFSYRGLKKVKVQWSMICTAYNLTKWNKINNSN